MQHAQCESYETLFRSVLKVSCFILLVNGGWPVPLFICLYVFFRVFARARLLCCCNVSYNHSGVPFPQIDLILDSSRFLLFIVAPHVFHTYEVCV